MAHAPTVTTTVTQPTPDIVQVIVDQLRDSRAESSIATPSAVPSTTRAFPNTPLAEELERAIQNSHRILTRYRARLTREQPQEQPINKPRGVRIEEPTTAPSQTTNSPNFQLEGFN